ncbi:hypothetical protein [Hymenobacter properus]|uniref:Uncharacterized protein n=1 Tax=Hymenobacter properus TaxID=2791026 RepID=A0A931BPP5_9BACT|nr:hypothetical protein [Hymenobacter properus]MBF9144213.1 hypothetical protein [Hymenobacter properus]MBR7723031.1 hypothetical protein [Microvirga sp. SRT04]
MKHNVYIVGLALMWFGACHAQPTPSQAAADKQGEFGPTANGLVYSPHTMNRLRRIVDSLNLKHKVCELRRAYRSYRQGQASYIALEKGDLKQARLALEQGLTPEAFQARFPAATVEKDLLVISYLDEYEDNSKKPATVYRSIPFNNQGEHLLRLKEPAAPAPGRWVIQAEAKSSYSDASLRAFYFPDALSQPALPAQYANLVQYADCLIDTTAQIYFVSAKRTGVRYRQNEPRAEAAFMSYAHEQTQQPKLEYSNKTTETEQKAQWAAFEKWQTERFAKMDQLARTPKFRELLAQAVTSANTVGATDDEFEEYVARYYSPQKALEFKRSRIVVGGCSMDDSPRRHALGIATLSAETVNWETFLRAHLDIMNDRFERVSDGSYAWAGRKTYLRELEELDINVPDLMLGISLRIDNASRNHYFGSLGRLGRALAETQQPRELEQRLLGIVADPSLDAYNRVLAYYLFLCYNNNLEDKELQQQNIARLNTAVQKLPTYLVARATVKEEK